MTESLLYLMTKPPPHVRPRLADHRAALKIGGSYSADRHHCTLLRLGMCSPTAIHAALQALSRFREEPFPVIFDHIEGGILHGRKAQPGPSAFQRALARHMIACGAPVLAHRFRLHLTLDYDPVPKKRTDIPLLNWTVDRIDLVESVQGEGRHVHHGCLTLVATQGVFPF